jgi:hypothetical protein
MAPPFVERLRDRQMAEAVLSMPDPESIRTVPRARDNPILRAAEDLAASWEEMRLERDEARLAAERDRQENLRLSERVDALERELREKVAFLVEEADDEKRRALDFHGQAQGLRASFSVIVQALLYVVQADAAAGGVLPKPPPIEEQPAAHPAPEGRAIHPMDLDDISSILQRLPPNSLKR